ncbi:DUF4189 domain-containing protein [Lysobacter capsici]|uniref:DUF4189 domain-containing protein n=1 Tax=Lysobacter capsici TaxID=435897 RepID=UPI003CCDDC2A
MLVAGGMLSLSGLAAARGCPAGVPSAGNPGCIPPDQSNSPYYQSGASGQSAPAARWADRWGAIAIDDRDGGVGLGTAQMMTTERKAKKTALDECRAKGGTSCRVILAYYNQCGVVVAGDAGWNSTSAGSVGEATKRSFEKCEKSGLKNCKVYYSNCSLAERVR